MTGKVNASLVIKAKLLACAYMESYFHEHSLWASELLDDSELFRGI